MGRKHSVASSLSAFQHRLLLGATALLFVAGGIWLGCFWGAEPFIRAVYNGDLLPYLGDLLRTHVANNPAHDDVGFYVQLLKSAAARLFLLAVVFWGLVVGVTYRRPSLLTDYFAERGSPLSLAVFRIVVFGLLLSGLQVPEILDSARQAQELRVSPPLMGWLFDHVPLGDTWVRGAARSSAEQAPGTGADGALGPRFCESRAGSAEGFGCRPRGALGSRRYPIVRRVPREREQSPGAVGDESR